MKLAHGLARASVDMACFRARLSDVYERGRLRNQERIETDP